MRRAASCDQTKLRSSNLDIFQVYMAMINVNVIGDLPNLRRDLQFMEILYRRQPRARRSFQIRGERSGNCQQIDASLDIFPKKAQRNRLSEDFCHAPLRNRVSPRTGTVPRAGVSQRLAECNSAIQRGAAKPQPNPPRPPSRPRLPHFRLRERGRRRGRGIRATCDDLDRY